MLKFRKGSKYCYEIWINTKLANNLSSLCGSREYRAMNIIAGVAKFSTLRSDKHPTTDKGNASNIARGNAE